LLRPETKVWNSNLKKFTTFKEIGWQELVFIFGNITLIF